MRTATFDNLFETISVFASDGRLYLWNRRFCELWELDEEWLAEHPRVDELVPAMARRLVNPTAAAQVREMVRDTTTGRQSGTGRLSMTDGRHFEFAAVPLPDGNALFTMIDVTDSSRIEAALRERATGARGSRPGQDRLRRQHELRIAHAADLDRRLRRDARAGYAGKLAAGRVRLCRRDPRIGRAAGQADRRRARPDPGRPPAAWCSSASGSTWRACAAPPPTRSRRAPPRRSRSSKVEIDPSTGVVVGDARRLRESIEHVLRNAVAYTPEGGNIILVGRAATTEAVTVTVADNGPGIAPEDQQDGLQPLPPRGRDRSAARRRSGLGLPLTRQFIEAHGGTVELESEPGKGTARHASTIPRAPQ